MAITIVAAADWPGEEATLVLSGTFVDDAGDPATPSAATWTLTDDDGNVINSRSAVALAASSSYSIALSGNDLAIGTNGQHRAVLLEWTYTSSAGSGLKGKHEIQFQIVNLIAVT